MSMYHLPDDNDANNNDDSRDWEPRGRLIRWLLGLGDDIRRQEMNADPFLTDGGEDANEPPADEFSDEDRAHMDAYRAEERQGVIDDSNAARLLAMIDAADHDDPPRTAPEPVATPAPAPATVPANGSAPIADESDPAADTANQTTQRFYCPGCTLRVFGTVTRNKRLDEPRQLDTRGIIQWCNRPACVRLRLSLTREFQE